MARRASCKTTFQIFIRTNCHLWSSKEKIIRGGSGDWPAVDHGFNLTKHYVKTVLIQILYFQVELRTFMQRHDQPFPWSSMIWTSRLIKAPFKSLLQHDNVGLHLIPLFHWQFLAHTLLLPNLSAPGKRLGAWMKQSMSNDGATSIYIGLMARQANMTP